MIQVLQTSHFEASSSPRLKVAGRGDGGTGGALSLVRGIHSSNTTVAQCQASSVRENSQDSNEIARTSTNRDDIYKQR